MRGTGLGRSARSSGLTLLVVVALCLLPQAAWADAGTWLLWAVALHLVAGNAVIGALEGWLLSWLFKTLRVRSIGIMIGANYVSMVLGSWLLVPLGTAVQWALSPRPPLYTVTTLLAILWLTFYLISILVEWPFAFLVQAKGQRSWLRGFGMSAIAQTASYAVLVPWYFSASYTGVITETVLRHDLGFVQPPVCWVYFISPQDGCVWKIRTDGTQTSKVLETDLRDRENRLYAELKPGESRWDLCVVGATSEGRETTRSLVSGFARDAGKAMLHAYEEEAAMSRFYRYSDPGRAADLRPTPMRTWTARCGFWAAEGLTIQRDNETVARYSMEVPGLWWPSYCPTILPSGQIVYQLDDQIVILDPESREIGFLALGRSPVVALDE